MKQHAITVSVLMGVLNRNVDDNALRMLQRTVRSILNQSYPAFELLIEDSGSSGVVSALLDQMATKDQRLRVYREPTPVTGRTDMFLSLPAKLNRLLTYAQGQFIARMDDEDVSHRERLAEEVYFLQSHPEVAFVGTNVVYQFPDGTRGRRILPSYPTARDFAFNMPFIHASMMFRREAFSAVNGYREVPSIDYCEDYDLLLRMYAVGLQGANLSRPLYLYRVGREGKLFRHRVNEVVTRYERFRDLGMLPMYLPFVVKPLVVALIPPELLRWLKHQTGVYRWIPKIH